MSSTINPTRLSETPCREVKLPPVQMDVERLSDGSMLLRASEPLRPFDPNILRNFLSNAARQPEKTLYAQRAREADGSLGDWNRVSFEQGKKTVESIGQWLLNQGLKNRDTVLIISGNSIAHAMIRLGSMAAGITVCPISANYALMGGAYERIRYVIDLVQPKVIFAETGGPYDTALQACDLTDRIVISCQADRMSVDAVSYESLLATEPGDEIRNAIEQSDPDEHAVYMLTSGSTGMPKAVIQTQRMLSTNMHQAFQVLGHASGWDDVMLDWLPWSHVSGAFNLLAAAVFGGTLYIDDGKPAPGLFEETIRNLREIAVPYFCNVPAGFAVLVDVLEADEALRKNFFSRLRMILYGGAGLPQPILERLQTMAIEETGYRIFMTTGYGATETASGCMAIFFDTNKVGIGLPMPGLETKLVPQGDRYEVRLRGDNIMPGYLHNTEGTAKVFDEEGFYRTGDAARFHDENDVSQGLYFAGRLAEEFKLGTGTWVYAGQVRARLIEALSPTIGDLLLCGIGRDYLAVLGVPNLKGLQEIAGAPNATLTELSTNEKVMDHLRESLESYNAAHPASSTRIRRFAFMREAPSAARHELSDKGTLNQLIASENRAEEIDELYAPSPGRHVLVT
jgi:feruloyl-CoA synthase